MKPFTACSVQNKQPLKGLFSKLDQRKEMLWVPAYNGTLHLNCSLQMKQRARVKERGLIRASLQRTAHHGRKGVGVGRVRGRGQAMVYPGALALILNAAREICLQTQPNVPCSGQNRHPNPTRIYVEMSQEMCLLVSQLRESFWNHKLLLMILALKHM